MNRLRGVPFHLSELIYEWLRFNFLFWKVNEKTNQQRQLSISFSSFEMDEKCIELLWMFSSRFIFVAEFEDTETDGFGKYPPCDRFCTRPFYKPIKPKTTPVLFSLDFLWSKKSGTTIKCFKICISMLWITVRWVIDFVVYVVWRLPLKPLIQRKKVCRQEWQINF